MARLVAESGSLAGREWRIDPGLTLGREGHNSVPMPDNRKASRDHAKVWREAPGRYSVADLGSTNGTLVNDEKVTRQALVDGDEVRVGEVAFRFLLDEDEKPKKAAAPTARSVLAGEAKPSATAGSAAAGADPTAIVVKERVLQYQKKSEKGGAMGWDLSQMSGPTKWGFVLGALALAVAIVWVLLKVMAG